MSEQAKMPVSTRDALITELLSDVGNLHDEVKALPKALELSMSDSLLIVANAVDDAEKTALLLQQTTNEVLRATSAKAGIDIGIELASAVHLSLEKVFEPALARAAGKLELFEARVAAMSGQVRDLHATRFNYVVLVGFIVTMSLTIGALCWTAIKAQDVNETNKWFYDEYKAQRAIIETLPSELKQRFKR